MTHRHTTPLHERKKTMQVAKKKSPTTLPSESPGTAPEAELKAPGDSEQTESGAHVTPVQKRRKATAVHVDPCGKKKTTPRCLHKAGGKDPTTGSWDADVEKEDRRKEKLAKKLQAVKDKAKKAKAKTYAHMKKSPKKKTAKKKTPNKSAIMTAEIKKRRAAKAKAAIAKADTTNETVKDALAEQTPPKSDLPRDTCSEHATPQWLNAKAAITSRADKQNANFTHAFTVRLSRAVVSDLCDRFAADLTAVQYKIEHEERCFKTVLGGLHTEHETIRKRLATLWACLYPNEEGDE